MANLAKTPQRERTTTSTTAPTQNTTTTGTTTNNPPAFLARFLPKSNIGRLGMGMLILFVGMQALEYLLFFVAAEFKLNLNQPLGKSVPLIGGLTWFMFIWLLLIFGLYIALLRLNIIPSGKTYRAQRAAEAAARTAPPAAPTTHAERKRAARQATITTATTVSTARRPSLFGRLKSGQTGTAKASATSTARVTSTASTAVRAPGISDDAYDRAKAAQRTRRRREAKR